MKKAFISSTIALVALFVFTNGFVFALENASPIEKMESVKGETHHLEVKPETIEGYRLPYMKMTVTIIDQDSKKSSTLELHPMFGGNFHYGANVSLEPRKYLLRFQLEPPTFAREDPREKQWLTPLEAEFEFDGDARFEESIKIGQKDTADMKVSFEAEHAEEMFIISNSKENHQTMGESKSDTLPTTVQKSQTTTTVIGTFLIGLILGFIASRFWKPAR